MQPMKLHDATRSLRETDDWDEKNGECQTLDIHDGDDGHGNPVMVSAWQLSPGELEKLAAGAPLFLRIYGTRHPVVALFAGEPTLEAN